MNNAICMVNASQVAMMINIVSLVQNATITNAWSHVTQTLIAVKGFIATFLQMYLAKIIKPCVFYSQTSHFQLCYPNCNSNDNCPNGRTCFDNKCLDPCDNTSKCMDGFYCHRPSNVKFKVTDYGNQYFFHKYNISSSAIQIAN